MKLKIIFSDIFFLALLLTISTLLISFYFQSNYLKIWYFDWLVHGFRIKTLYLYGPISWVHTWSNGANIWQSYQFIPHLITLLIAVILKVEIARAMVLATIFIFIFLRIEIYILLRMLKIPSFAAFVASLLTFTIPHYWSGVIDFSVQFSFIFFPFIIFVWTKYRNGKFQLIFPFMVGLTIYIHPVLTFFSGLLWLIGLFISNRKVLSLQTLIDIIMMGIASSLFLYPYIFNDSYKFVNPYFSSHEFLSMQTQRFGYFGIGLILLVLLVVGVFRVLGPIKNEFGWLKPLLIFCVISILLLILANITPLPRFISAFQFPRGATLIGIAICFVTAVILRDILQKKNFTFYILIITFSFYVLVDGIWSTSVYSPMGVRVFPDPLLSFDSNKEAVLKGRLYTPTIDSTSYYFADKVKMPHSYMSHFDSNQLSFRISNLVNGESYASFENSPTSNLNRINDYMKVSATDFILLYASSPVAKSLIDPAYDTYYKNLGKVATPDGEYYIFETPWESINASLVSKDIDAKLAPFPNSIHFTKSNDYIELDQYIHELANVLYSDKSVQLPITYPTQDRIEIKIPSNRETNIVYIAESHSNDWVASFNGEKQIIKPVGPNYMAVYLSNDTQGGVLRLKHNWPKAMIGIAVIIILTPFVILLYNIIFNFNYKRKK